MRVSSVVAVVDSVDAGPVVWWVDLGVSNPVMSRLGGAWVLDTPELRDKLVDLVGGRVVLATAAGGVAVAAAGAEPAATLDIGATHTAVEAERDLLQQAFEQATLARKGKGLIAPAWPTLPEPLDPETAAAVTEQPQVARALGIARWLADLCRSWDRIEELRLARSYLRPLGGDSSRALPVVTCAAANVST